jgi:transcriptional/translational regulatory protein YebC/TACO1
MFEQKGVVIVTDVNEEKLLEASIEGGADSYEMYDDKHSAEVLTEVANLENLNQTLQKYNFLIDEIELRWIPNNTIEVSDPEQERSLIKLLETLESLDDVQKVTANFELSEELAISYKL